MRVSNMTSNKGNKIANQFIITTEEGEYFQSYNSIIAFIPTYWAGEVHAEFFNKIKLDVKYWNYSATTGKYRNQFLGEKRPETQIKIDLGIYELVDLNKPS